MAQDLRKLLRENTDDNSIELEDGHKLRFEARLDKVLPQEEIGSEATKRADKGLWMKIAAVVIVMLGILWLVTNKIGPDTETTTVVDGTDISKDTTEERQVLLSDLSPDFKKVEDYYTGNIKLELARLEINDDNQELVDSFLAQLEKLDTEYKKLNQEIVQGGLSEETVAAMIDNLKLRLELLFKLKSKLKELKAVPESGTA